MIIDVASAGGNRNDCLARLRTGSYLPIHDLETRTLLIGAMDQHILRCEAAVVEPFAMSVAKCLSQLAEQPEACFGR
jgi:hypothetical protein